MLYKLRMAMLFWRRDNREDAAGYAPISLRLTLNGRVEISTGLRVPEAYWAGHKLLVQLPAARKDRRPEISLDHIEEWNRRLRRLYDEVDTIREKFRQAGKPYTAQQVAERLREGEAGQTKPLRLVEVFDLFVAHMRRPSTLKAPATLVSYASRLANLRLFLRQGPKRPDLLLVEVSRKTGLQLEQWSQDQGHSQLTTRKQINMLQMVLSFAVRRELLAANPLLGYSFETKAVPAVPITLPAAEVGLLEQTVFADLYLREVADMWLFMCYTGLSYVDYIRYAVEPQVFTHADAGGIRWIRMVRQKMQRRKPEGFSVPLLPGGPALALLRRRRHLLPRLDNAYANRKLKEISQALGLSVPLTCKVARATFSQLLRDKGVSGEAVAAMMGDTETVMNRHYSRIREERIAREFGLLRPAAAVAAARRPRYHSREQRQGLPLAEPLTYTPQLEDTGRELRILPS